MSNFFLLSLFSAKASIREGTKNAQRPTATESDNQVAMHANYTASSSGLEASSLISIATITTNMRPIVGSLVRNMASLFNNLLPKRSSGKLQLRPQNFYRIHGSLMQGDESQEDNMANPQMSKEKKSEQVKLSFYGTRDSKFHDKAYLTNQLDQEHPNQRPPGCFSSFYQLVVGLR